MKSELLSESSLGLVVSLHMTWTGFVLPMKGGGDEDQTLGRTKLFGSTCRRTVPGNGIRAYTATTTTGTTHETHA